MAWDMTSEDDFDGVQYDDMHAPSAAHLEAEEIRREVYHGEKPKRARYNPPPTYPPGEFHYRYDDYDEREVGGVIGAGGLVYSDADPGL